MRTLTVPGGELRLDRMPLRNDDRLQAWDAADEYLLSESRDFVSRLSCASVLLVNDAFGALACALAGHRPASWGDSHLGELALRHNLEHNGRNARAVEFVPADRDPERPGGGGYDLVLLKIPKSMAAWEDQLLRLRPLLAESSRVIAGGMIKHTPRRAYELLETVIGPTKTSLGWKKARLAESVFEADRQLPAGVPDAEYELPGSGIRIASAAHVFSRRTLDPGTRLLLECLPATDDEIAIADLGCGAGPLALTAARQCPRARVLGVDESYQAIASARRNAGAAGLDREPRIRFEVADGLAGVESGALDWVVCNPPFHQGQGQGDQIAWEMFRESKRALRAGGRLLVVGNRHLGYHWKLERLFARCETVASDPRFVVLMAV